MKTLFLKGIILFSVLFSAMQVMAEEKDIFFGMGYHVSNFETASIPDATPASVHVKFGKYFSDNFSIQGQYLMSAKSDTKMFDTNFGQIAFEFTLDRAISIHAKQDFRLPFASRVNFYSLVGVTEHKLNISIPAVSSSSSVKDSGFSFGFGFENRLQDENFVYLEYLSYPANVGYELTALNIGMGKRF